MLSPCRLCQVRILTQSGFKAMSVVPLHVLGSPINTIALHRTPLQSLVARAKAQRFWRPKRRGGRNPNLAQFWIESLSKLSYTVHPEKNLGKIRQKKKEMQEMLQCNCANWWFIRRSSSARDSWIPTSYWAHQTAGHQGRLRNEA